MVRSTTGSVSAVSVYRDVADVVGNRRSATEPAYLPGRPAGGGFAPRSVLRGVKSQGLKVGVRLHWLRVMGDESQREAASGLLTEAFGQAEEVSGGKHYKRYFRFEAGAMLRCDPRGRSGQRHCQIDLPGAVLDAMTSAAQWSLIAALRSVGFGRAKRVDLAADFKNAGGVGLVDSVLGSCEGGELCRAKRYGFSSETCSDGERVGRMVTLGRRGSKAGSGRYGRVYDKGLETGECGAGQWERFEVELSGAVAEAALYLIEESEVPVGERRFMEAWDGVSQVQGRERQMLEVILGSFDFRERNGQKSMRRRGRVSWWRSFVSGVAVVRLVKAVRVRAGLEARARWLRRSVLPDLVEMARRTGEGVEEVIRNFVGSFSALKRGFGVAVSEYESLYVTGGLEGVRSLTSSAGGGRCDGWERL